MVRGVPGNGNLRWRSGSQLGQPVEGIVAQDGVLEQAQPFVDGPVAGDYEVEDW